jgi:hypothetical protein
VMRASFDDVRVACLKATRSRASSSSMPKGLVR